MCRSRPPSPARKKQKSIVRSARRPREMREVRARKDSDPARLSSPKLGAFRGQIESLTPVVQKPDRKRERRAYATRTSEPRASTAESERVDIEQTWWGRGTGTGKGGRERAVIMFTTRSALCRNDDRGNKPGDQWGGDRLPAAPDRSAREPQIQARSPSR